ncbi:MAG: DoxX family protein [Archangium sp.]|nr:DoxX family protein [Archangium sp.]
MSSRKTLLMNAATALLVVVFVASGVAKLLGVHQVKTLFGQFGLPHWALVAVGAVELTCAGLLLSWSTRAYGALGLAMVMIGASLAHVMTGVMLPLLFANAILCFIAGWVVLQHRPSFLKAPV